MKLCTNCKHCIYPTREIMGNAAMASIEMYSLYKCAKSSREVINMVDGTKIREKGELNHCADYRYHGECGVDGKFWEAK